MAPTGGILSDAQSEPIRTVWSIQYGQSVRVFQGWVINDTVPFTWVSRIVRWGGEASCQAVRPPKQPGGEAPHREELGPPINSQHQPAKMGASHLENLSCSPANM